MLADYHVHCAYSDDSEELMETQILKGISLGLNEICFTDHVDYGFKRDWNDPRGMRYRSENKPLNNVDYPNYFTELKRMGLKYSGLIDVKSGLEFGIQTSTVSKYKDLFSIYKNNLDFIILSIHQINGKEFANREFQCEYTQKEYYDKYYNELYQSMKLFKQYSVLGHLDLLCRYDLDNPYPFENVEDIIAEILKLAIKDNKGLEINTSSWKFGMSDTLPSNNILKLYKDLGGEIITVGSDAHSSLYLGSHIKDALNIIKSIGFNSVCTFEKMVPTFHKIDL